MNAIGDATMALALFLLIQRTGSLDFEKVFPQAGTFGGWAANLIALGLLGGAVAKSAQLPLQTWLPDAMEGPTPVSALIHAATMVTAGVYLIVRTHALFEVAPHVQELAAGLGAATLLMAGLIALVQTDIKRVIAYSTMSQIGYMFLAVGIGAYANGMFHLMTHAFFKALLFLAAGLLIHALAGEQDLRKMGGLQVADAAHVLGVSDRRPCPRGNPAAVGLLLEGPDPGRRAGERRLVRLRALGGGHGRNVPDRALRLSDDLPGVLGRAVAVRARAPDDRLARARARGPRRARRARDTQARRRGAVLDDLDSRGAGRAGRVRRLDPVRRPLDADLELARPGRTAAGRRLRSAGGGLERRRGPARARGHRRRVVDLRRPPRDGAAVVARARAQVLVRRGLRRALLPARGAALAGVAPLDRTAARLRLGRPRSRRASATSASARAACRPGSCARTCSRSRPASPS